MSFADVLRKAYCSEVNSPIDLVSFLNKKLGYIEKTEPRTEDHVFRVSEAIDICPREEFLRNRLGVPRVSKIPPLLKMTFDFGNAFHSLVQNDWLGKSGNLVGDWRCKKCASVVLNRTIPDDCFVCGGGSFLFEERTVTNKEYGISGHPDGVLVVDNHRSVLELKTFSGKYYSYVILNNAPIPKHVLQAQMYMWLCGERWATILYFNKEESSMLSYSIEYSHQLVSGVLANVSEFRESIRTDKLPERKICETQSCSRAKRCSVRKECFSR